MTVDEVEQLMQGAARQGVALTYAQALMALGFPFSRPRMRALCRVLDEVDARARGRGAPELAVLVVRQSDGLPGQGWWAGRNDGYGGPWEGPDAAAHVIRLQRAAFAYWRDRTS